MASHPDHLQAAPLPVWQQQMRQAIRRLDELLAALALSPAQVAVSEAAAAQFPVLVPPALLARMQPGDARDPLLLQVLPRLEESLTQAGFVTDPLAEQAATRGGGLLQKYPGRLLLVSTGACAVHCRYCFRRHFPYTAHQAAGGDWDQALQTLRADATLTELILSGGDPLMLSNRRLATLLSRLYEAPQLRRVRLHTRMPVVLPARIDDGLLAALAETALPIVIVLHVNHPRELDQESRQALARLRSAGAQLLNQAVLLRDVNDDLETQADLWESLHETGVLPYYLHLLDPVAGASHFDVPESEGRALLEGLRARLPGYLVPRLVREIPGRDSKTVLG
jgi:EF-P beta-lysylation protein EpmB